MENDNNEVTIKSILGELMEEAQQGRGRNLTAEIRECIDEIEYLLKKGYSISYIVDRLKAKGIDVTVRQLNNSLYNIRKQLAREEGEDHVGRKRGKKSSAKQAAPAPVVAAPSAEPSSKFKSFLKPAASGASPLQPVAMPRTRVTAEMRREAMSQQKNQESR